MRSLPGEDEYDVTKVTLVKHVLLRPLLVLLKRESSAQIQVRLANGAHDRISSLLQAHGKFGGQNALSRNSDPSAVYAAGGAIPHIAGVHLQGNGLNSVTPFTNPGVLPPSLHVFPLINPSTHFSGNGTPLHSSISHFMPITHWMKLQGHPSPHRTYILTTKVILDGKERRLVLPVLDLLVERQQHESSQGGSENSANLEGATQVDWFPDRQARCMEMNPQALWKLITSYIVPELMDSLVQCYLSTSSYLLPFLHVPTFLSDYGNPQKWAKPGFANFIVAVCCVASHHIDDARVPDDRPTLYNIQANLLTAVYAVGSGKLTKSFALFAETCTMYVDAGLHRSADNYDLFDPIDNEVRKRTFWCVYLWDKQMSAHFGRPPILRLRDCDVGEPTPVDDEYITREAILTPHSGTECRMNAFIIALRIFVILESVLDMPPARLAVDPSSFLIRATRVLSGGRRSNVLREEETLLDDIHRSIPDFWAHTSDSMSSEDTIRLTQTVRLHCAEHFVRLLIYRHRFSQLIAERTKGPVSDEQTEAERAALVAAQNCNTCYRCQCEHREERSYDILRSARYSPVDPSCKTDILQHLIPPGLDALRSSVGLLRRFSSRYVCGLRSGAIMEEFCRQTSYQDLGPALKSRPPWIRPARKKASLSVRSNPSDSPSHSPHQGSPKNSPPSEFLTHGPTPSSNIPPNFPPPGSSSFMDASLFLHQSEEELYLSTEFNSTFNDVVDSAALYGPDYLQVQGNLNL